MDDLPTPLNRVELYLGTAAQMAGVTPPEEPLSRLEQYLAFIAGDTSVDLPAPASLCEQWLAYVAGITPAEPLKLEGAFHVGVQKVDVRFFAVAAGMPGVVAPEPQNRTEQYWARLAEILPVHGVLKNATGTNITLTDVAWWKMGLERINGDTFQQTYSGAQLLKKQGMATPKADSDFWYSISNNVTKTDKEDGWATFGLTSTASFSMFSTKAASVDMLAETTYTAIVEVKNCTFTAGTIVLAQTFNSGDSVSTFTVVEGCESSSASSPTVKLDGTSTAQFNVYVFTTKSTFTIPLRYFFGGATDLGTADIRATVLAGDHSADWQNYCGDNWQPYVGGVPAPSPNYPQAINTVTGEQTVEIRGKNYLELFGASNSGVTGTPNPDGSITITGKANTSNGVRVADSGGETPYIPAGTYTFTIGKPRDSVVNLIVTTGGGNVQARITAGNTSATITTTSAAVSFGLFVAVTNGVTYNETIQLQLTAGSSADTDFQPYQKTEYKINLGKNLFDKDNPNLLVAYIDGSHTTITANGKNRIIWIPCKANQTYTIQKYATNMVKEVAYTTVEPAIGVTVSGMVSWAANTSSIMYTTGADAEYLVVRVYQSDNDAAYTVDQMLASVKIWEGGEDSAPIELCKIGTYQDYIYKSGDDWFIHKEIRHLSLPVASMNNTDNFPGWKGVQEISQDFPAGYNQNINNGTSSIDNIEGLNLVNSGRLIWGANVNSNVLYANRNFFGSSWTQTYWETNYNDLYIELYYGIVNPITDTKITNQALISQLNALDRAVLPQPVAYLSVDGDLPGELKISYYGEEE